jgi:hypothetical protein
MNNKVMPGAHLFYLEDGLSLQTPQHCLAAASLANPNLQMDGHSSNARTLAKKIRHLIII